MNQHGYYRGHHYTSYVEQVMMLIQTGETHHAEKMLLNLLDVIEAENDEQGAGVAPWYYKKLARIYWQRGEFDAELAVIERYYRQPNTEPQPCFEARLAYVV